MGKVKSGSSAEHKLVFQNFLPCRIKAINEKTLRMLAKNHERIGISTSEFAIMVLLAEQQGISSRDIHKTTGMDKATITRTLNRLIEKMLISRSKSKIDNRLIIVALTSKGKRTVADLELQALDWQRSYLKGVKLTDLKKFNYILDKLDQNLAWLDQ